MKDIEYFFEWMSPQEVARDFGIPGEEVANKIRERGMRTQTTRHGDLQIYGQDLQAWYEEIKAASPPANTSRRPRKMLAISADPNHGPLPESESTVHSIHEPRQNPPWLRIDSDNVRWVTVARAAEVLHLPQSWLRRRLANGLIHSRKVGARRWILEHTLKYLPRSPLLLAAKPPAMPRPEPQAQSPQLITRAEAARILNLSVNMIQTLAGRGILTRVHQPQIVSTSRTGKTDTIGRIQGPQRVTYWYRLAEIEALAAKRQAERNRPKDPRESLTWWGDRSELPQKLRQFYTKPMEARWIPPKEAARILGVTTNHVHRLVRRGILPAYQKDPGKPNSRMLLYHLHVISYRDRESRLQWHARHKPSTRGAQPTSKQIPPYRTPNFPYRVLPGFHVHDRTKNIERDYGEYFTTRQVAILLGVNPSRVRELRLTNRLKGFQRPQRLIPRQWRDPEPTRGRQWWFFKKEDVYTLLADPTYTHHRKGYDRWNNRQSSSE